MKILVSGGAGFIGSHLTDYLLERGHEVMVLDILAGPDAPNLTHLGDRSPRFRTVAHDITSALPASVRRWKPEQIYNLACSSGPEQRRRDPVQASMTNVVGSRHLLDLARDVDARYLQGSSSGVYGDPAVHPQPESYLGNVNALGPRAAHDEAKRCAEALCISYRDYHAVDTRIARMFSAYGPRMSAASGRVISNFITQALNGDDLTIYGDGTQSRSFCFVDDMVRGLVRLMECEPMVATHADALAHVVNLGSAEEHNLLQVAERVLRLTGSQSRLRHVAPRLDDAHSRRPDVSLAERSLGWRPRVPLQQGLQSTVEFFRRQTPTAVHT